MPSKTKSVVYVALYALLLVFAGILLLLGPAGWVLAAFLLGTGYVLARWSGLIGVGGLSVTGKVSCPDCGARNDADRDACHHCDEPLPTP